MEDWITGTFAVLGTLFVLAGGTLVVLRTIGAGPTQVSEPAASESPISGGRRPQRLRLTPPIQLVSWGVVLLVIAAITTGVMGFKLWAGTDEPTDAAPVTTEEGA